MFAPVTSGRIRIATDGSVSATTMAWRYRGRMNVTAIVKASFSILHGRTCVHRGGAPIVDADRTYGGNPMRSVEHASDLVPYRGRCDVLVRGHAHVPGGDTATSHGIRVGIARGGHVILNREVQVVAERDPSGAAKPFTRMALTWENALGGVGQANPVGRESPTLVDAADAGRPAGLGAISPFWPVRKRLLGAFDRRLLDEAVPALPDTTPWEYFQCAPVQQQIEPLAGGETLVLDGVHPTMPRIEAKLPVAHGAVRLVDGRENVSTNVELRCDTMVVDVDRQTIELVWRGHREVDESTLEHLLLLATLAWPDAPPDFSSMLARVDAASVARGDGESVSKRKEGAGDVTIGLGDRGTAPSPALPFGGTSALGRGAGQRAVVTDATPWAGAPLVHAPIAVAGERTLDGPRKPASAGDRTHAIGAGEEAAIRARPIAPYELAPPKPNSPADGRVPWKEPGSPPVQPFDEQTVALEPDASPAPPVDSPLANQLKGAGASGEEIAALLAAISAPK